MAELELKDYYARLQLYRNAAVVSLFVFSSYMVFMLAELHRSLEHHIPLMIVFLVMVVALVIVNNSTRLRPLPEKYCVGVTVWRLQSFFVNNRIFIFSFFNIPFYIVSIQVLRESDSDKVPLILFAVMESFFFIAISILFLRRQGTYRTSTLYVILLYVLVSLIAYYVHIDLNILQLCALTFSTVAILYAFKRNLVNPIYYGFFADPYIIDFESSRIYGPNLFSYSKIGEDVYVSNVLPEVIDVIFDSTLGFEEHSGSRGRLSKVIYVKMRYRQNLELELAFPQKYQVWFEQQREANATRFEGR